MNSFGRRFILTTFGESHGVAIGAVIDGYPAGVKIDLDFIQSELDRRKPGKNRFATQRDEEDKLEILSGVFEGLSTGTPIGITIHNCDQKSKDYNSIKDIFRPGHADFTYFHKYGVRDYRGGGRSSARETAMRVCGGAFAKLILRELGIEVVSGVFQIGDIVATNYDFEYAKSSEIFALDKDIEELQKAKIDTVKSEHDSIGGAVVVKVKDLPVGLGEPIYYKLDALLADAMMSINGVKGVEIGSGVSSSHLKGSENNDLISVNGFKTNHSGGTLGGISNGSDIEIKVYFKPTPSIFRPQESVDIDGNPILCELKGRHDPCIAIRGSIVAEAMASIVIADMLLLNMGRKLSDIKKLYID